MSTSTIGSATAAPATVKFEGHDVVEGKVQPNKIPGWFGRSSLEASEVLAPIQTRFTAVETKRADDAKKAQEAKDAEATKVAKEAADKKAEEDAANAESMFYTIVAAPFRAVAWVFGQIASFFGSIFSICFGKSEEKADDKKVEGQKEEQKADAKKVADATVNA